jgi:hypothetical protein
MATTRKTATSRPSEKSHRIRIEIPQDADKAVVQALRAVAHAIPGAGIEEHAEASPNSYSLTVHVIPDAKEETV